MPVFGCAKYIGLAASYIKGAKAVNQYPFGWGELG